MSSALDNKVILNEKAGDLIERIAKNDEEAMSEFFEDFSDIIYNFPIKYYNFTEDEAGDLYLYAFEHLKNGRKLSSFKGKSKFTTWFHSVLRNLTIDFLRSQKEKLRTTNFVKIDDKGNIIDALENIPDSVEMPSYEEELFKSFVGHLRKLKISQRVLFKLAYTHYIDLDNEELQWLCQESKLNHKDLLTEIMRLKEIALKKETDVRILDDKLTANFQQITALENKIRLFFRDHPEVPIEKEKWSPDYEHAEISMQTIALIHSLSKKKKKHINILNQQKKGLLSVRVPYKEIAELMNISKGVLSVQLLRIVEKLNQQVK